jgi:nitronate monooxygenase
MMTLPKQPIGKLRLPVIGAPMFLVSFPPLVTALCKAGLVGSFPHVNARSTEELDAWLTMIEGDLADYQQANPTALIGPIGVNLVLHDSNTRYIDDLDVLIRYKVPIVLTSLGNPGKIVEQVHEYGGLVFSDVINARHAQKAADAGVDGIICIGGGAGGHAPVQNLFSLAREVRKFWQGCLILGGAINDGQSIRACEVLGADLAYVGTRFVATKDSNAQPAYKDMIVKSGVADLVYTDRLSGIGCNYLIPSLEKYEIDLAVLPPKKPDLSALSDGNAKLWRDIWTAGHGIANIHSIPSVETLVSDMEKEYHVACKLGKSVAIGSGVSDE